jgi:hypothetical protein
MLLAIAAPGWSGETLDPQNRPAAFRQLDRWRWLTVDEAPRSLR